MNKNIKYELIDSNDDVEDIDKDDKDMYDVSRYTDIELYNILDLNANPSDRELEAKIVSLIRRYEAIGNDSANKLANFFTNIYDHFFDSDEEPGSVIETFDNMDINGNVIVGDVSQPTANIDITGNNMLGNTQLTTQIVTNPTDNKANAESNSNNIVLTKPMDFTRDTLNPLLKQTVTRVITIDSLYREDKNSLPTDFTFNLSDPLKDVVSMKLYSIQIPFTWYTISTNYGCNFFYFKGNSPGINDGNYDFQVDISAGNYLPADLVTTINNSIQKVKTTLSDISFGNTSISYNNSTSLTTFNVDIYKLFTETSYYLDFPDWSSPNDKSLGTPERFQSIPGYLGYNNTRYYPYTIYSDATLPLSSDISVLQDYASRTYFVDDISNTNNTIIIETYFGPDAVNRKTKFDASYVIQLKSSGAVTRNELIQDLSLQLATLPFLYEPELTGLSPSTGDTVITRNKIQYSSIVRKDIIDPSLANFGKSYFELKVKLNRYRTNPFNENIKTRLIFPTEPAFEGYNNIWTGLNSCFRFSNTINELTDIISETPVVPEIDKTFLLNGLQICIKCTKPYFELPMNDYIITTTPNLTSGYTLTGFSEEVMVGIENANTLTKGPRNPNGDFNIATSYPKIVDNYFTLQLDINKYYRQDKYIIDLSGSSLNSVLNFDTSYNDLSTNNILYSAFPSSSSYTIDSSFLMIIRPNPYYQYGNKNQPPIVVAAPPPPTGDLYGSYDNESSLETAINDAFANAVDLDGEHILTGTHISVNYNLQKHMFDCSFIVNIQKTLTERDFSIAFIDPSFNNLDDNHNILITDPSFHKNNPDDYTDDSLLNHSAWYRYFNIDTNSIFNYWRLENGIPFGTSYSYLRGTKPIIMKFLKLIDGINNTFYLRAYEPGILDHTGPKVNGVRKNLNDIAITLPAGIDYTRNDFIQAFNIALNQNPLTIGSSISIVTNKRYQYTKIRLNINKAYYAGDYRLVFYDPISFAKCYPGVTSVRNTTWDTTLGWILGFRAATVFALNDYAVTGPITLTGDTTLSVVLYNYFLLCLDDFSQSHLNDGLVTLANKDNDVPLPSYADRSKFTCDPVTNLLTYNIDRNADGNALTQNQLYSLTEIANNKNSKSVTTTGTGHVSTQSYATGPYVKDVFGIIPLKLAGLFSGGVYVDYGGTLQNQERTYFGPVNIHRMAVKLVSDRGDVVNLNGCNWSFALVCEQLYQQKPGSKPKT